MTHRAKKFFVHLLCCLVPNKAVRRRLRASFLPPQPPDPLMSVKEMLDGLFHRLEKIEGRFSETIANNFNKIEDSLSGVVKNQLDEVEGKQSDGIAKIKFEIEKSRLLARMDMLAKRLHPSTFAKYKNAFENKDVVLIATGPSLANFKPIENAIYIGVNSAFRYEKVKLDYLFMCDYPNVSSYIEEAGNCLAIKFYGIVEPEHRNGAHPTLTIPESIAIRHGAARFYENNIADPRVSGDLNYVYDITAQPLTTYASIVFLAMQFILYGNPRRVYLVGCDVSSAGHFCEAKGDEHRMGDCEISMLMRGWVKMREFVKTYYPETEIVSINPMKLKGVFKDKYQ